MAYWVVISKTPHLEDASISYFIQGVPGRNKWVYHLESETTNEFRLALATEEYEVGKKIHDADLIKVL